MNGLVRKLQKFRIVLRRDLATRMTCSEANCQNMQHGWVTILNPSDDKHVKAAAWIEGDSGRKFTKLKADGALEYLVNHREALGITVTESLMTLLQNTPAGFWVLVFPPGQQCFTMHLDREVVFAHDQYVHIRPLDFNEDFNIEADKVNTALRRG